MIIEVMVIDMNETQVRTLEQVRKLLDGTHAVQLRPVGDDQARYRHVSEVLLPRWARLNLKDLGDSPGQGFAEPAVAFGIEVAVVDEYGRVLLQHASAVEQR